MAEINDLKNAWKSNELPMFDYAEHGNVGNSESGQGFKRTQKTDQTVRVDTGVTYTYIGYAIPGTATSASGWKIKRITNADNTILYADGDPYYDNVWDNHATTVSYS